MADDAQDEWKREQLELRRLENEKWKEKKELEIIQAKDLLWLPYKKEMETLLELNMAWKEDLDIFKWSRVLFHENLIAIRITGQELEEISNEVPDCISQLQSLSFIATKLQRLPDNVKTSEFDLNLLQ